MTIEIRGREYHEWAVVYAPNAAFPTDRRIAATFADYDAARTYADRDNDGSLVVTNTYYED